MTVAELMPELRGKFILCADDVFRPAEQVTLPAQASSADEQHGGEAEPQRGEMEGD